MLNTDMIHDRRECSAVDRPLRLVRLDVVELFGEEQLGRVVLGRGHEERTVFAHLHVVDETLVPHHTGNLLTRLQQQSNYTTRESMITCPTL